MECEKWGYGNMLSVAFSRLNNRLTLNIFDIQRSFQSCHARTYDFWIWPFYWVGDLLFTNFPLFISNCPYQFHSYWSISFQIFLEEFAIIVKSSVCIPRLMCTMNWDVSQLGICLFCMVLPTHVQVGRPHTDGQAWVTAHLCWRRRQLHKILQSWWVYLMQGQE